MATLTPRQIYDLATKHGANKIQAIRAASIALAESGGNTTARNVNNNGSVDRGIWQINNKAWPDISDATADNPDQAAEAAKRISKNWTDFSPWSTYKSGAWRQHVGKVVFSLTHNPTEIPTLEAEALNKLDIGEKVTGAPAAAVGAVGGAIGNVFGIGDIWKAISSVEFWKRVGIGALALFLIVVGLFLFSDLDVKDLPSPVPVPV